IQNADVLADEKSACSLGIGFASFSAGEPASQKITPFSADGFDLDVFPVFDSRNRDADLRILALNAPASPLSPVTTTSNTFFSGHLTRSGCSTSPVAGSKISARVTS